MKKKGLIISTVVMVVVLIASLTTATYAWFNASANAKVGDIQMAVGASSKVQIGMRAKASVGTSETDYKSGTITFGAGGDLNDGTYDGLGSLLETGIMLDVDKGVGTGTEAGGNISIDNTYNPAHSFYKGSGTAVENLIALTAARVNGDPNNANTDNKNKADVLDFALGIRASQADVYGTFAKITVTIPENQTFMGMITALHAEIKVGNKTYSGDIFGDDIHFDSKTAEKAVNRKVTFYFMINEFSNTTPLPTSGDVTPFSIKMFISGYDTRDCVDNATGTGATISLDFDGCAKNWQAGDGWKQLTLTQAAG